MTENKIKKTKYTPSLAVPPGETLLEVLENKGMTQTELANRTGRPLKTINEIVKGETAITAETAIQFEQTLGVPAHIWNNLESGYREILARLRAEKLMQTELEEAEEYPYIEMVKWGWVPMVRDKLERTKNLLLYFGVTSLKNVQEKQILSAGALYRISTKKKYSCPAIAAWLRRGTILGQETETKEFNAEKLKGSLVAIKTFTSEPPQSFQPKLRQTLSDCGVALVLTPNLKNAPINGASRWLTPNKALIQLTIRHKYNDIFWFSLFHEIGHILSHEKRSFNVDFRENGVKEEKEVEADKLAADTLIPPDLYPRIVNVVRQRNFSNALIKAFATMAGVHPAIVVGRLQHDKLLPPNFNSLRERFEWVVEKKEN